MKIQTRIITIFSILLMLLAAIISSMSLLWTSSSQVTKAEKNHFSLYLLSDQLRQTSDDLTKMARTYAVTSDPQYKQYFDEILKIRNGEINRPDNYNKIYWDYVIANHGHADIIGSPHSILDLMKQAGLTSNELALIEQAKSNSDKLAQIEKEAFAAMEGLFADSMGKLTIKGSSNPALSRNLLYSESYHKAKANIMLPIDEFMRVVEERTQRKVAIARTKQGNYELIVVSLTLLSILVLVISFFNIKKRIADPLKALTKFVQSMYMQDEMATNDKVRTDEISTLTISFNNMLGRISEDRTEEVQKANQVLSQETSERKYAEQELTLTNEKYQAIFDDSVAAIYIFDAEHRFVNTNKAGLDLLGYTKEELFRITLNDIEVNNKTPLSTLVDDLGEENILNREHQIKRKDNTTLTVLGSSRLLTDTNGQVTGMQSTFIDMSEKYKLAKQLSYQASHDALTGIINRTEFERLANKLLKQSKIDNGEHVLCFLDLDRFKMVNDTCGHAAGDELLCQISKLFKSIVRKHDILARFGGDEFAVLLEECSIDQAKRLTNDLLLAVKNHQFLWGGETFVLGVSIGLTSMTPRTPNISEALKEADTACYRAKDLGRNQIHAYQAEDSYVDQYHGEMQWIPKIYKALEQNLFCLYAQMIEPLNGRNSKHYELLIRMKDSGKTVPPGAFLPVAERYEIMPQLDSWVIQHAFEALAHNQAFLKEVNFISINLSGQSLAKGEILDLILEQFDTFQIPENKICFEITETAAISNLNAAIKFISTLKAKGCLFALDDFGSGLSSFGYLKNLPVDYLKIDGMFVKGMANNPIDHAMVKSINEIGQVMGMKTIAEFVENDDIKTLLKDIGVNYGQGYGIDKPRALTEIMSGSGNTVLHDTEEVVPA